MTTAQIIAQIFSASAYVLFLFCYHGNNMKKILSVKLLVDLLASVSYILLGAYSGLAMNLISATRAVVFMNNDKKYLKSVFWKWLFIFINIFSLIITWKAFYSLLPAIAGVLSTISFWQKDVKFARILALVINVFIFSYNLFVGSYAGMIGEAIAFCSVSLALYKNNKNK